MLQSIHLLLASKSPRRKQLLEEAGFTVRVDSVEIQENFPATLPAIEVAGFLAEKKGKACAHLRKQKEILLAADSIVTMGNEIFHKPTDAKDAYRILHALSGKKHQVITGVYLFDGERETTFSAAADVEMYPITDEEIDYYVHTFMPYDKAGAYAIQEWIGLCKIKSIHGSYYNIMGLPVSEVYEVLKTWGIFA